MNKDNQDAQGQDQDQGSEADQIVESERAGTPSQALALPEMLRAMGENYRADPVRAVRTQEFI